MSDAARRRARNQLGRIAGALVLCAVLPGALHGQDEAARWHVDGYQHRAVVRVVEPGDADVRTATLRLRHAGRMGADANDLRVRDADGKPVPYQVTYHHPTRDTLISFRATGEDVAYYVYFDKKNAKRDPYRAVSDGPLGIAPPEPGPATDWTPRAGLVLTTRRRPEDAPNPQTLNEYKSLVTQSPRLDGARYQRSIRDGLNPFGDSDHYLSLYQGWLRVPEAGEYGFCTASNEASFSFLDGEKLVHWPGRHTEKRGKLGQKNTTRTLDAGLHYVTYLHEEVLLYQVAFLGVRPPGQDHFDTIPRDWFPKPHRAAVRRYEKKGVGVIVMPRLTLLDSVWPRERDAGQYTRFRCRATAGAGDAALADWSFQWSFGDGITASGREVTHVYLATGEYDLTLRARSSDGDTIERHWPVTVFPIEHLRGPFERGDRSDYTSLVNDYDPADLRTPSLIELAHYRAEFVGPEAATPIAEAALARKDMPQARRAELHALAAGQAGLPRRAWIMAGDDTTGRAGMKRASQHLRAAHKAIEGEARRIEMAARLIRHTGIARGNVKAAIARYKKVEQTAREQGLTKPVKAALRHATIAIGDVRLIARRFDEAASDYQMAEALAQPRVPDAVRAAKTGTYPERIERALAAQRQDRAADLVRAWRRRFPADLLDGQLPFWIGRLALARAAPARAVRPLKLAIERGGGAPFEAEARWRLAEAHRALGHDEKRRTVLRGLVQSGLAGPWREKAVAALEEIK